MLHMQISLHSHNISADKSFARLVKDRLDIVIQQCCSCQWFENMWDQLEKCVTFLILSSFISFIEKYNNKYIKNFSDSESNHRAIPLQKNFVLFFPSFNQFTIAFGFCHLFLRNQWKAVSSFKWALSCDYFAGVLVWKSQPNGILMLLGKLWGK